MTVRGPSASAQKTACRRQAARPESAGSAPHYARREIRLFAITKQRPDRFRRREDDVTPAHRYLAFPCISWLAERLPEWNSPAGEPDIRRIRPDFNERDRHQHTDLSNATVSRGERRDIPRWPGADRAPGPAARA